MRLFKLINGAGNEFDLMRKDAFFYSPDGLGLERNIETVRSGKFYFSVDKYENQKAPTGTMIFKGYTEYKEFIDFIKTTPLKLGYNPLGTWNYADCEIQNLEKAEIGKDGLLKSKVTFLLLSPFYTTQEVYETITSPENSKTYSYSYPYNYYDTGTNTIKINVSEPDSPVKLHIFGACVNPRYYLVQSDTVIASGGIDITLTDSEKLIIDANPQSLGIIKCNLNNVVITDAYEDSDFSTERFLYAPLGESYITFSDEALNDLTVIAEVSEYADSV